MIMGDRPQGPLTHLEQERLNDPTISGDMLKHGGRCRKFRCGQPTCAKTGGKDRNPQKSFEE